MFVSQHRQSLLDFRLARMSLQIGPATLSVLVDCGHILNLRQAPMKSALQHRTRSRI